jgi:hypothetical protein
MTKNEPKEAVLPILSNWLGGFFFARAWFVKARASDKTSKGKYRDVLPRPMSLEW